MGERGEQLARLAEFYLLCNIERRLPSLVLQVRIGGSVLCDVSDRIQAALVANREMEDTVPLAVPA